MEERIKKKAFTRADDTRKTVDAAKSEVIDSRVALPVALPYHSSTAVLMNLEPSFLVSEYLALWEAHGLEDLQSLGPFLEQRLRHNAHAPSSQAEPSVITATATFQ